VKLSTLFALARGGSLGALRSAQRLMQASQRSTFLAAAASAGVLRRLAREPVTFSVLAAELTAGPEFHDALREWLEVGVGLSDLSRDGDRYALRSSLARRLADPEADALSAFLEETASLHHTLLWEAPRRLREGRRLTLADQDGELIARSSRLLEPFVGDEVDAFVPKQGAVRLLEIGCGSGVYVRRAAQRNPALTATALELQPQVAALAKKNLAEWGLAERATVEVGDVREREPDAAYELATLHNNIYYFPVPERVALLRHVRGFLQPGGKLLLTTGCRGGSSSMSVLSLWGALTEGAGQLPEVPELERQLREAGFASVTARRALPGEAFFAFVAQG
jgi:SAM-dependent methyltransferase